jgi:hypothetical protein
MQAVVPSWVTKAMLSLTVITRYFVIEEQMADLPQIINQDESGRL